MSAMKTALARCIERLRSDWQWVCPAGCAPNLVSVRRVRGVTTFAKAKDADEARDFARFHNAALSDIADEVQRIADGVE